MKLRFYHLSFCPLGQRLLLRASNITEQVKYFSCLGSSYAGDENQNLESRLHHFKLLTGKIKWTALRKFKKHF